MLFKPAHLRRTLTIAFLVGSWLTLVNLGDAFFSTGWSAALLAKTTLNYLTPFVVANLGLLARTTLPTDTHTTPQDQGIDEQT